jgi:hypothetical protein
MQRIFINKCFLFTVGSVCRVNWFTIGWQRFLWWRRGWNWGAEVVERTVKRLLCCRFWRIRKAKGQVYQMLAEDMSRNKCFPTFEYHMFYVLYPFTNSLFYIRVSYDCKNLPYTYKSQPHRKFTASPLHGQINTVAYKRVAKRLLMGNVRNIHARNTRTVLLCCLCRYVIHKQVVWSLASC